MRRSLQGKDLSQMARDGIYAPCRPVLLAALSWPSGAFHHGEALEDRRSLVKVLVLAGILVGVAEIVGFGPGHEVVAAAPDRVRGVERIAFFLVRRPAQQVELHESGHFRKARIPVLPYGLERLFRAGHDLE